MTRSRSFKSSPSNQSGFSMVELLIAAFIMAFGILGLLSLMTISVAQASSGRGRVTATYVAEWVLQRAQMEGQESYFAKINSLTLNMTRVFTDPNDGSTVDLTTYGGFNVDGVQVTDNTGADLSDIATSVPDANRRAPIFTASWSRRAYKGTAPASTSHSQEFVVNVSWVENNQTKYLSMSRIIRY